VKATVEPLEGNKVKLSVEVHEDEFERAIDAAFRKIAREVRIPGFRPGKAPRKVLEARIGADAARHQALHDSIPEYYAEAVRTHDVDVIAAPEIDLTDGEETGGVAFDAVVEVRPVVTVPGYASLQVTIPSPEPSDDDVDAQLETLRTQFAELAVVERPAAGGDYVTVDIAGSQDGEPLEGLTADDYLYPLGSGAIVPELDDELAGAKPGDILEFDAAYPGAGDTDDDTDDGAPSPLHFRVLVKEVKAQVLPDLDDDFAAEASEFETLDELRDDLRRRMGGVRRVQAQMALREKVSEALAELVDEDLPDALVTAELNERLQDLALRLQAQGITLEQWLAATGKGQEELITELRQTAAVAAKVDLALRAVAEAQGIEVDDDDLQAEYDALAERVESTPAKVRQQLERADQVPAIRSDLKKRKALEWLLDAVTIVDEEGLTIDRSDLELPADPDADADADDGDEDEDDEAAGLGDRPDQPEASDASDPSEEEDA
jgi:trigger factor